MLLLSKTLLCVITFPHIHIWEIWVKTTVSVTVLVLERAEELWLLLTEVELEMKKCDTNVQHHKHKACAVSVFSSLTIQSHDRTQCTPVTLNIRLSGLSSRLLIGHSFCLTIERCSKRSMSRVRLCKRKQDLVWVCKHLISSAVVFVHHIAFSSTVIRLWLDRLILRYSPWLRAQKWHGLTCVVNLFSQLIWGTYKVQ